MRKWLINIYNELVVKAEQSQYLNECHVDLYGVHVVMEVKSCFKYCLTTKLTQSHRCCTCSSRLRATALQRDAVQLKLVKSTTLTNYS